MRKQILKWIAKRYMKKEFLYAYDQGYARGFKNALIWTKSSANS